MVNVQEKMRSIKVLQIKNTLKSLLIDASFKIPADIIDAVKRSRQHEGNKRATVILDMILENSVIAANQSLPLCQDCGTVYVDIGMGPDVCIDSSLGFMKDEINNTVAEVYKNNYLRTSIVTDPFFERNNTGNNTPAIINVDFKKGLGLSIDVSLKGGGSENCSWLFMLNPSTEKGAIIDMILKLVKENASKACPPIIVGIGMGSTASEVLKLARKAVFRNLEAANTDSRYLGLEKEILSKVNETGIGPQGLGGDTTALACNIEFASCHMATLPFAIMFGCHSTRRASFTV
jgi:fumarate hydratase subunit alpha